MSANKVFGSKYRAVKKRISSRRMDSHARCARAKRALSSGGSTLFLYLHLFSFSFSFFLNNEKKKKSIQKKACSLCRSVTETPVPAIEAGRGRRGAAVRGRRLTLLLPTLLALCWLMELCGRDGLFGVTSPLRMPTRTHPRWTSLDLRVFYGFAFVTR